MVGKIHGHKAVFLSNKKKAVRLSDQREGGRYCIRSGKIYDIGWPRDLDTNNSMQNLLGHNDMPDFLAEQIVHTFVTSTKKLFTLDYTRIFGTLKCQKVYPSKAGSVQIYGQELNTPCYLEDF